MDWEFKLQPAIIPGILEKEWSEIEKKIELVRPFARTIHVDLLDGKFAPNTTLSDPKPFAKYSKDIFFEVHMMVENPMQYLKSFAESGFKRFIGHIEKMAEPAEFIAQSQDLGEVGLAIDGPTSLEELKVSIEDLDMILIFTGEKAGFSGEGFKPERLEKVKKIRENYVDVPIEIDGGVCDENIKQAFEAGVNRFATTSCLFGSVNPESKFHELQKLLDI